MAVAALGLGIAAAKPRVTVSSPSPAPDLQATPRVHCEKPGALRLLRFEDGSAQLRCAARVLVRVAVPW